MTSRSLLPFDPETVAPWRLGDGRRGVLLIHGFAGTPPELRGLGEHLSAQGWRCHAPALAGHGTTPEEMATSNWEDWASTVQEAFDELCRECDSVAVAGQSMGGALALHLAATDLRVLAVAALAAPVHIGGLGARLVPLLRSRRLWHVPTSAPDLYRREGNDEVHSYGRRSLRAVDELFQLLKRVRGELAMIRAPVLVLQGGRDRTVNPANSREIVARLVCSAGVERHLYPRSGHILSVDVDRDDINARILAWFERWSGRP